MLFGSLIQLISKKIPIETVNVQDVFDIRDVALIDGVQKEYSNNVLYIGYYEQINSKNLPSQCVLVRTNETSALKCTESNLALVERDNLFFLMNAAKSLVDASRSKGLYAELMDCAAQTKSITSVLNLAASKLGNSLILLDTDFKVLDFSKVYPIDDPLWKQNIKQGYCDYEFISAVNELDSIKNAPDTSEPVAVTCYASPMRKLSSKIFHNGQKIGFIMMLEKETALSPAHFEMLRTISAATGDTIARFAPYLLPDSTNYQRLLYDMLIGTPPQKLAPSIAKLTFSPNMCVLCLKQNQYLGQKHLKERVAQTLKSLLLGTQLTFHDNGIAALVPLENAPGISPEQLSCLDDFAKAEFLRIGISNTFFRIENFARQYIQACHAIELDQHLQGGHNVCCYIDYEFFDMLSTVKDTSSLESFCHPALTLLKKYDHDNDMDLYHTLNVYLSCGCSIKLTAEKLFIHRNSLSYRLKRIAELTQADLEDSNTRFLLEMSYRIDHFTNGGTMN